MNWTYNINKHYSAEHLNKTDKTRLAAENPGEREKLPKQVRSKRHPRLRR